MLRSWPGRVGRFPYEWCRGILGGLSFLIRHHERNTELPPSGPVGTCCEESRSPLSNSVHTADITWSLVCAGRSLLQPRSPIHDDMDAALPARSVILAQRVDQESLAIGRRDEAIAPELPGKRSLEEHAGRTVLDPPRSEFNVYGHQLVLEG